MKKVTLDELEQVASELQNERVNFEDDGIDLDVMSGLTTLASLAAVMRGHDPEDPEQETAYLVFLVTTGFHLGMRTERRRQEKEIT